MATLFSLSAYKCIAFIPAFFAFSINPSTAIFPYPLFEYSGREATTDMYPRLFFVSLVYPVHKATISPFSFKQDIVPKRSNFEASTLILSFSDNGIGNSLSTLERKLFIPPPSFFEVLFHIKRCIRCISYNFITELFIQYLSRIIMFSYFKLHKIHSILARIFFKLRQ